MSTPIRSLARVHEELAALKAMLLAAPHDPLQHEGGFHEVVDRFNDLADDPYFLRVSRRDAGSALAEIVATIAPQVVHGARERPNLRYLRVEGTDFIHGGGPYHAGLLVTFYFETERVGLFLYSPWQGSSMIARITATDRTDDIRLGTRKIGIA